MNPVILIKALADETRLRIINLVGTHELNVGELTTILEMGQSRISRHLKILTGAGVLGYRRDGLWSFYSLAQAEGTASFLKAFTPLLAGLPQAAADLARRKAVLGQRTRETAHLFSTLAGNWDKITGEIFGSFDLNAALAARLVPCAALVDIGCGTGALLAVLKDKARRLIGVDNAPGMLEKAARYLEGAGVPADLRLGNIEHLPLGNGEAEAAVLSLVLHHCEAPARVLKEAHRVLARGGVLLAADFLTHNRELMRTKYGDRRLGFAPAELAGLFGESGFGRVEEQIIPLEGGLEIIILKTIKEETNGSGNRRKA